ncbi:hypothetical protein PINS_up020196 [Pythium insidiosum]|nr:hypothetical protein PINS_up020196 [Pythium insidiosum]
MQLGCRVSEEFSFSIDDTHSQSPPAVFYVLPRHQLAQLVVVLKVAKTLVGDPDTATAPYCQPERYASEAEQLRLREKSLDVQRRLGRYRQTLAWGVLPLAEGPHRALQLYRQRATLSDDQRLTCIADALKGTHREKLMPAVCELSVERLDDRRVEDAKFASTGTAPGSLELDNPFSISPTSEDNNDTADAPVLRCREVQPLCPPSLVPLFGLLGNGPVALGFVHALYVYPLHLDRLPFRNIAVRIHLLARELDFLSGADEWWATQDAVVRGAFFDSASCRMASDATTLVNYHQKSPQFESELKLALPERLTRQHHLLFTLFHVHCKKIAPHQPQQELVGCAVLPLLQRDGALLGDRDHTLAILQPPPTARHSSSGGVIPLAPGYVDAARVELLEPPRTTLVVRTRALSSVRSQDSAVAAVLEPFQSLPAVDDHDSGGRRAAAPTAGALAGCTNRCAAPAAAAVARRARVPEGRSLAGARSVPCAARRDGEGELVAAWTLHRRQRGRGRAAAAAPRRGTRGGRASSRELCASCDSRADAAAVHCAGAGHRVARAAACRS